MPQTESSRKQPRRSNGQFAPVEKTPGGVNDLADARITKDEFEQIKSEFVDYRDFAVDDPRIKPYTVIVGYTIGSSDDMTITIKVLGQPHRERDDFLACELGDFAVPTEGGSQRYSSADMLERVVKAIGPLADSIVKPYGHRFSFAIAQNVEVSVLWLFESARLANASR